MSDSRVEAFVRRCARSNAAPAVVLGTTVNALSFVRSLGRKGVPVLCADVLPRQAGRSRFGVFYELARAEGDRIPGEAAADRLFSQLAEHDLPVVVLGSSDAWQVYLSQREERGGVRFISLTPAKSVIDMIVDKQAQYEFAQSRGVPVPKFANAGTVYRGEVEWDTFPAIVKPRWSHEGREAIGGKGLIVEHEASLHDALVRLRSRAVVDDYIVQRVVSGGDNQLFAYLACYDAYGREFSSLVKRKLRQHPARFGDGTYDVTCENEQVVELGRRLIAELEYRGLVGVEFKRDSESGAYELIEINPRAVSTTQIAIAAGVDFPWQCYQLALHGVHPEKAPRPEPPTSYRIGVHHLNEERDLRAFRSRWSSGEIGLWEWVMSVLRARSFAVLDLRDPVPFLAWVVSAVGERLGKMFRRQPKPVEPAFESDDPAIEAAGHRSKA